MAKTKKQKTDYGELLVCRNPKATKLYDIEDRLEAGMVLSGSEVKSLRGRQADLDGAFGAIEQGEMWMHRMHIAPYDKATVFNHDPRRKRKLLLHRQQIERWQGKLGAKGYTIVPLAVYFKNGYAKMELGLGKGKNVADRRHELRAKQDLADAKRAMGRRR